MKSWRSWKWSTWELKGYFDVVCLFSKVICGLGKRAWYSSGEFELFGGDRLHVNKMSDLCIFAGDRGDWNGETSQAQGPCSAHALRPKSWTWSHGTFGLLWSFGNLSSRYPGQLALSNIFEKNLRINDSWMLVYFRYAVILCYPGNDEQNSRPS